MPFQGESSFRRRPESSEMACAAHDIERVLCASHAVFKLDSGLRRNDERKSTKQAISLSPHHLT